MLLMLLIMPSSLFTFIYIGPINMLGVACYYFLYCVCKEIMLDTMTNVSVIQHKFTMYWLLPSQYSSFPCMPFTLKAPIFSRLNLDTLKVSQLKFIYHLLTKSAVITGKSLTEVSEISL